MKKQRIVFIGGIGNPSEFGGELTKNKELIHQIRSLGYTVYSIDSYKCHHNILRLLRFAIKMIFALFFLHHATFLFSTSFGNMRPIIKFMAYLPFRYRIIYWVIGGSLANKIESGEISKKDLGPINLFIVEGLKMQNKMKACGYESVRYVPNFKTIGDLPAKEHFSDNKIHFVFLSRIVVDKGCNYILESARQLNNEGLGGKFMIDFYGTIDDDYKDSFINDIESLDNVCYNGYINLFNKEGYEKLARYNVMLFPTYWMGEGFPGVIIDSYKCGLPIIASDWHLNSEFVRDGITGLLIPTHSQLALTDAMRSIIDKTVDVAQLSENCNKEVWKYDTATLVTRELIDDIFKS